MKISRTKIQSMTATAIVMVLLFGGGTVAFATRVQDANGHFNAPGPSDNSQSESSSGTSTTWTSSTSHAAQRQSTQTTNQTQSENQSGANESSTANQATTDNDQEGNDDNEEIEFSLVPTANNVGHGEVKVYIVGTELNLHVELSSAKPSSNYAIQVIANKSAHDAGTITTDSNGNAKVEGVKLQLQNGTYSVGVNLLLVGAVALQSDPATQVVPVGETKSTTTESEHQTETQNNENQHGQNESQELKFSIVPATSNASGRGKANIEVHGLVLDIQAHVEKASPSTQYSLALLVNGTVHTLGTLVTSGEGDGEIHAQFKADKPGTYVFALSLLQGTTLELKGDPESLKTTLTQSASNTGNENQGGEDVNKVQANQNEEQQIKNAEESKAIPAVVQFNGSEATASVLDSKFSVSVAKLEGSGLAIQISANNVTGPRVLLVNVSGSVDITSHSLLVTFDGKPIEQASTVTEVLNPSSTDPAKYIVAGTSSGVQLLVSIPHFSLHTIELFPMTQTSVTPATPQGFLASNGLMLLASATAITAIVAAIYAARKRINPA